MAFSMAGQCLGGLAPEAKERSVVFTAQGYVDGVSYAVRVGVRPDAVPAATGIVDGSMSAIAVLRGFEGDPISLTPTGPVIVGSLTDRAGVLAVLLARTQVTKVEGDDVPDLYGPFGPGLIY